MAKQSPAEWARIRERYEMGEAVTAICASHGISRTGFYRRANREGWQRNPNGRPQPAQHAHQDTRPAPGDGAAQPSPEPSNGRTHSIYTDEDTNTSSACVSGDSPASSSALARVSGEGGERARPLTKTDKCLPDLERLQDEARARHRELAAQVHALGERLAGGDLDTLTGASKSSPASAFKALVDGLARLVELDRLNLEISDTRTAANAGASGSHAPVNVIVVPAKAAGEDWRVEASRAVEAAASGPVPAVPAQGGER